MGQKLNQRFDETSLTRSKLTGSTDAVTGYTRKLTYGQLANWILSEIEAQVNHNNILNRGSISHSLLDSFYASKAQPLGLASLDAGGKVPVSQLPSSIMQYQGTWDADTNTPSLADGTGDAGDVYIVNVDGTHDFGSGNISFNIGDWAIYNGTIWEKSDNTDAVTSVFGRQGAVTAQAGDYTTDQITEGTKKFSFWGENSGNIFYNSGKVGIGTTNPLEIFHIGIDNPTILLGDELDVVNNALLGVAKDSNFHVTGTNPGDLAIRPKATGDIVFGATSTADATGIEIARFKANGNFGFGVTDPRSKLDVDGVITNEPTYPAQETNVIGSLTVDFAHNVHRNLTLAGDITLSALNSIGSRGQKLTIVPNGHEVLLGTGFVQDGANFDSASTEVTVWLFCYSATKIGVIFINRA